MKPFNLLTGRWIPVKRRSGAVLFIAPHEITSDYNSDPIVELAAPRPDFNGALIQFLIGLIQTTFSPADPRTWRKYQGAPPPVEELERAFSPFEFAFNLDGEGPRFMQDYDSSIESKGEARPINRLLINEPGEKSEELNKDFFVKRGVDWFLSAPAAAMALLTIQLNAPSGGQGHRTSLRGGGPLTTIVRGSHLWGDVWCNVVEASTLNYKVDEVQSSWKMIFPWVAPTKTSSNDEKVEPVDSHPLAAYWACPRRIRLIVIPSRTKCAVFDSVPCDRGCHEYVTKNYGNSYSENWIHPLTPYVEVSNQAVVTSVKTPEGGIYFRNWLGVVAQVDGKRPAVVIQRYAEEHSMGTVSRIRCFGYAMDNMKPLNWIESDLPLYVVPENKRAQYAGDLSQLVKAAAEARRILFGAIGLAMCGAKSPPSLGTILNNSIEPKFYAFAGKLVDISDEARIGLKTEWLDLLRAASLTVFDNFLLTGDFVAMDHPRVFGGRAYLQSTFRKSRGKLEGILELPLSESRSVNKRKIKTSGSKELAL